jgi:hypothetical protein
MQEEHLHQLHNGPLPLHCKLHNTRPLDAIVSSIRDKHAWVQVCEGWPQQLQAKCNRVDAANDAAVQTIRDEIAELKLELQRACVGDVEGVIQEQAQLLAVFELPAASPKAAADCEGIRCLLTATVSRTPCRNSREWGEGGSRLLLLKQ